MNREIKFRLWNPTINKMLDWNYLSVNKHVFFNSSYNWMQFTGLTDKAGNEIYEGDIIRTPNNDWGVIVYKAPFFEVTVSETQSCTYNRDFINESEVIGNIYENPDLLK